MTVTMDEAATQLDALIDRVVEGEQVTILRQGIPVAKLGQFTGKDKPDVSEVIQRIEAFRAKHGVDEAAFREMMAEGKEH